MAEINATPASPQATASRPSGGPLAWFFRIVRGIGKAVFLFGVALAVGGCPCARFVAPDPAPIEFPLSDLNDIATDSHGRIYVAVGFYFRVQRYSPEGKFELGWTVPTAGFFALRTTPDDQVLVATARADKLLTYSPDGQLLSQTRYKDPLMIQEFASETETTGHYAVRGRLFPQVVDTRTGETVISTPWPLVLLAALFPAAAYFALGVLLVILSDLGLRLCTRRGQKHVEEQAAPQTGAGSSAPR